MESEIGKVLLKAGVDEAAKASRGFLLRIAGPAAEEVGLLLQDKVKLYRFRNQVRMLAKAQSIMREANLDPEAVPLRTLLPILEGAALEDDESLADKWAALLANAAAGRAGAGSHPSFPRILAELSPNDARFLDLLAERTTKVTFGEFKSEVQPVLAVDDEEHVRIFQNLFRLGLCWNTRGPGAGSFEITSFGRSFVEACRPKRLTGNNAI